VAAIAANNDETIGNMLAEAMDKVGKDGVITVEEAKSLETELDVVEGMQFDRGYLSPYFVTDPEQHGSRARGSLHPHPREEDLRRCRTCIPLLETGRAVGQAAAHHRRGRRGRGAGDARRQQAARHAARSAPSKAPGFGDRRKAMLEDIADPHRRPGRSCEDLGIKLENIDARACSAAPSRSPSTRTTPPIVDGAGQAARPSRAASSRSARRSRTTTSDYDREKLQERLAKLAGGVAVIKVGARDRRPR